MTNLLPRQFSSSAIPCSSENRPRCGGPEIFPRSSRTTTCHPLDPKARREQQRTPAVLSLLRLRLQGAPGIPARRRGIGNLVERPRRPAGGAARENSYRWLYHNDQGLEERGPWRTRRVVGSLGQREYALPPRKKTPKTNRDRRAPEVQRLMPRISRWSRGASGADRRSRHARPSQPVASSQERASSRVRRRTAANSSGLPA